MKQTTANPRRDFLVAAANMSWQLAIVVLVPIVGGFELDEKLGCLPLLTIIGFVIAMVGMALVVWRQLQLYSPAPPAHPSKGVRS
ncbi:MAG TPA: AtpZ/AtpI family protein [Candidatus Saccharimonadales bacterium]|nr:AtpZ/AtpI family protein [Candidatus Saccharimonadales bacterium]